jgi:hypothetical protein
MEKNNYLFPLAKKKTTVYLLSIRLGKLPVVKNIKPPVWKYMHMRIRHGRNGPIISGSF